MASGPITLWQIDGETMEIVTDFILGDSKITADGDWSHEIKRCLLLGRKVMTNLDGILKSRDITLPAKVCLVKAMVFPVVMCGCESWTIKKAECLKIGAFELWCWRRLLRVPCSSGNSQESSPTLQFKSINSLALRLLYGPVSHPYMTTGKTIALTRWTFTSKVISLLFNMLSRFVIAFLPRGKHLLISWLQSPSAVILEPKKIKSVTASTFSPSICHEVLLLD